MMSIIFTLLMAVSATSFAQAPSNSAWRCGTDGRSYSDQPCAGGRQLAAADTRTPHDVAQAREVVARERALAQALVAERHEREREAAARGSGLIAIKPVAAPAPRQAPAAAKTPKKHRLEATGTSASTPRASRQTRG
jgi:hypothetical protein